MGKDRRSTDTDASHIAVVGGGFTGMVCALRLLQAGYEVTILESQPSLGGLTASQDFGPFSWDRFYHCILTSDQALLGLLAELDLVDQLCWTATQVGFFSHGRMHAMTSPQDLLRFPHLSVVDKLRLGIATLYAAHIRSGDRLEEIPLEKWTRRLFGARVYQEMWEPLFRCKLGEMRHQASAAFLWGTLRRLYSTREKGPEKQEKLGYVHGGYGAVFARLQQRVVELGGHIRTGVSIRSVRSAANEREASATHIEIGSAEECMQFDGAVLTLPNRAISACLETEDDAYKTRLAEPCYLGLICCVLLLSRRLSPFYVTNITEECPFTGIIEMTNLIDRHRETAGVHLVYLPRYTMSDDPLFNASDAEVWACFSPQLRRMHPDLTEAQITGRFVFRERAVQPVPTLGYSRIAPPTATPVPGVYVANTAQIINNTLNNNVMTTLAQDACEQLMRDIPPTAFRNAPPVDAGASSVLPAIAAC